MTNVLDKYIQQLNTGTPAVKQPAGAVNAYNIDPRLAKEYQSLVSAVNTGISNQPAGTDVLSKYLNSLTDFSKPAKKKLNPLQQFLSSKVVQTGLKPLEVLDYGRRGLTSLAKESYDYGKTGTFSVEDLKSQTEDPTFGVGQFVNTGNKWADRALGFAGDVAIDPLNYLTLGAGQFIGAGGRAALAAKLVRSGAGEATVSKAGRLGLAGLSAAEREAYSLPRAGLYVGQTVRIPGTEIVGQTLGRGLAEGRSLLGSTPIGGVIRRARTPEMFIEAAERLAKGKGTMGATEAASLLSSAKVRAGVEGRVRAEIDQEISPIMDNLKSMGDTSRLTNALERGDMAAPMAAQVRQQFDNNFNRMSDPSVGAITPDRYRPNYVPRIWTEAGQNILSGESKFARDFRTAFGVSVDDVRSPTATMSRVLNIEPGKVYNIGGKELTFATDTIDEINRVFRREFPDLAGANVLEDDIAKLLSGHSRQTAQAVGNQALARELEALGVGRAVASLVVDGTVDKKATKAAAKAQKAATKKFVDGMDPQVKAVKAAQEAIIKEYNDSLDAVGQAVADTLRAKAGALTAEQQKIQSSFNEFLRRSKTGTDSLERRGRFLDNFAEYLTNKIDESNQTLSRIDQFADSAEYQLLLAEKAYADQFLFHVKTAQASLDNAIEQTDNLLVKLPTSDELTKDARKAASPSKRGVADDSAKDAEPYRMVEGGEVVGKQVNAKIGLDSTFNDLREQVVSVSPKADEILRFGRSKYNKAREIELRLKNLLAEEYNTAPKKIAAEGFQEEYNNILGILQRSLDRAGKNIVVEEGKIFALPQDILDKYLKSIVREQKYLKMQAYESDFLPAVKRNAEINNELRSMQETYGIDYELNADGVPMPIEGLTAVRRLRAEAEKSIRSAVETGKQEMQQKLFSSPWLSQNVRNQITIKYEEMMNAYVDAITIRNRISGLKDLTSIQAKAAANDAISIQSRLESAALQFRIAADFAQRFQKTVDIMARSGQKFDPNGIATLVAKNVLSDEIKLANGRLTTLIESREKLINTLAEEFDTLRKAGNQSAAARAALQASSASDSSVNFIGEMLKEYDEVKRALNKVNRENGAPRDLTPTEMAQLGGSGGMVAFDGVSESSRELTSRLKEIQQSIELVIKGGKGQSRGEPFDFKAFIKDVYGAEKGAKGGQIRLERVEKWVMENDVHGASRRDYKKMAYESKGDGASELKKSSAIDALEEQILEARNELRGLRTNAELLGRQPQRLSPEERAAMKSLVDINDPVALAADTATRTERVAQIKIELEQIDAAIEAKIGEGRSAAVRKKYYQPNAEQQKALRDEHVKLERVQNKIDTQDFSDEAAGISTRDVLEQQENYVKTRKRLDDLTLERDKAEEVLNDLRLQGVKDTDIRIRKARKKFLKLKEDVNQAYVDHSRAGNSSGYSPKEREMARLQIEKKKIVDTINQIEDSQLRFAGQGRSRAIFEEQQALQTRSSQLSAELASNEANIKFNNMIINNPVFPSKQPRGFGVRDWQSVVFGGDPTNSKKALRKYRVKRQQIWEQELVAKKELALPKRRFDVPGYTKNVTGLTPNQAGFTPASQYPLKNQDQVNARISRISKDIEDAGGEETIVKNISDREAELATLESALVKAKVEPNAPFAIAGSTLEQAKQRKKYVQTLLNQQKGLLRKIDERDALGLELKAGLKPVAESRAAEADAALAARETQVAGAPFVDAEEQALAEGSRRADLLDTLGKNRQRIQAEIDNTKRIAEDATVATSEALIEVRDQISLVVKNVQAVIDEKGKVTGPRVKNDANMATIESSNKWLDEALAMTDPDQYTDRVGVTDVAGDLVNGTSEAAKFAYLFKMNYTPEQQATAALVAKAHSIEGRMLTAVENKQAVEAMVRGARDMKFPAIMKQQIEEGWKEISNSGIAVPQPVADAMQRIMRLDKPDEWRKFWSAWDTYTDVFKAYATLSPRFHVRNGLSATLMNYSDGVSTKSMIDGVKYWREFKNNPSGWLDNVPEKERKMVAEAVMSTHASGAGQYAEFKIGTKGTRNRVVQTSQKIGTTVEGSVRLGMAIDTLRRGGSFDEAVARINRVHFNYSDVSKVDGYAKKVIPFWTFMSRNIPLQMQQMWLKPRMYAIYGSAVRNFNDNDDNAIVPSYMMDSGAFKSPIGGGLITPDMPWVSAQRDIMNLASPKGWISSSTPALKVPVELYSGEQSFSGAPIGNPALYALRQALPLLGTAERLGGVGSQSARQGTNIAGFLGVPYAQPTVQQQRGEILRRLALARQATKD